MAFRLFLGWLCGGFEFASCRLGVGLVSALHRVSALCWFRVGFVLALCQICVGFRRFRIGSVSALCRFFVGFVSAFCWPCLGFAAWCRLHGGRWLCVGFVSALCKLCVGPFGRDLGPVLGQLLVDFWWILG